jgi:hypothetical protein
MFTDGKNVSNSAVGTNERLILCPIDALSPRVLLLFEVIK